MALRTILHLDLDCYYAQVEAKRLGLPANEPLAVQQWGGLLAVNYAARAHGVKRGMRVAEATALCPGLHVPHVPVIGGAPPTPGTQQHQQRQQQPDRSKTKVSLDAYRAESVHIFALLESLAPTLERASIDEAYVDVTDCAAAELAEVGGGDDLARWTGTSEWVRSADDDDARWRPDPSDPYDATLLAAAAVCDRLRRAVRDKWASARGARSITTQREAYNTDTESRPAPRRRRLSEQP